MAVAGPLILVANPGSASRKYALYRGGELAAAVHFEFAGDRIVCTLAHGNDHREIDAQVAYIQQSVEHVEPILREQNILADDDHVGCIGLRIVAPSGYFLQDHVIDDDVVRHLEALQSRAPLHIGATLDELHRLRNHFAEATIVGVSDSAFHTTKPDYAWNYGLPLGDADRLEIKRFGYHGISVGAVVRMLQQEHDLPHRLIVAHLGSGASVTAVRDGKSVDTTMGYSPLEGLIMATRVGTIDPTAVRVLKEALNKDDAGIEEYLNRYSGLQGLGGSSDIRELVKREVQGDHQAELALATYAYVVQKAIGQMAAALGGCEMLVFTGTVGERSDPMRWRIANGLGYLGIAPDEAKNRACTNPTELTDIRRAGSRPLYVIPTQEAGEIARRTAALV